MEPKAFDIHSHVNFTAFDADRDEVIKRAHDAGVWMINVGTEKTTSQGAVELSEKFESGVYATVGFHPIHAGGATYHDTNELKENEYKKLVEDFSVGGGPHPEADEPKDQASGWDKKFYESLARHPKVVAIGECGLDYYRLKEETKERQRKIFIEQIHLANEVQKPLMLHVRGERGDDTPYYDALELLEMEAKVKVNFHFFAGSLDVAKKIWERGFTASFTGVITFARAYEKIIKEAPLDMIMTETDCPYATPEPYRGRRNEPVYVLEVIKKIARIRGEEYEKVAEQLKENAIGVFGVAI